VGEKQTIWDHMTKRKWGGEIGGIHVKSGLDLICGSLRKWKRDSDKFHDGIIPQGGNSKEESKDIKR